jgi:phospholipase C
VAVVNGRRRAAAAAVLGCLIAACAVTAPAAATAASAAHQGKAATGSAAAPQRPARTPVEHFVFLMQGDRTFDNYFGTYPGTDGPPPDTCQALVLSRPSNGCTRPFPLHGKAVNPLAPGKSLLDYQYADGRMDGFVAGYLRQGRDGTNAMGYYDRRDLPYYWAVADRYVLFDRFFASARYGNRTNRSYWVSAAPQPGGASVRADGYGDGATIFDRLQAAGVSWKFYVEDYDPNETFREATATDPAAQTVRVPLLNYARFVDRPQLRSHIVDLSQYYRDLADGTLPAVAYVASSGSSERSARSIGAGQQLVQRLLTQLMLSDAWHSSAFLWAYDGSGGWFDHVRPPAVQGQPLGFRVPALLVSPFAAEGAVNHAVLDYTSALRFIEENWGLQPLTARDATATSLAVALDLRAPPRPPELIQVDAPPPGARVRVDIAYVAYVGAFVLAVMLAAGAAGTPWLRRRLGRPAPVQPTPEAPVEGRVVGAGAGRSR